MTEQLIENAVEQKVVELEINKVFPHPDVIRDAVDEEKLEEMAMSITEKGVIQPVVVRKISDDKYEVAAGYRRWLASKKAGLACIPCIVRPMTEVEFFVIALMENIQREELGLNQEARGYKQLDEVAETNGNPNEICRLIGKNPSHSWRVRILLKLLGMPQEVQALAQELKISKLELLQMVPDREKQIEFAKKAVQGEWEIYKLRARLQQYLPGGGYVPAQSKVTTTEASQIKKEVLKIFLQLQDINKRIQTRKDSEELRKNLSEDKNFAKNLQEIIEIIKEIECDK